MILVPASTQIARQSVENGCFSLRAQAMSPGDRRDMIQPTPPKLRLGAHFRVLSAC
jgi:hypothetical protein